MPGEVQVRKSMKHSYMAPSNQMSSAACQRISFESPVNAEAFSKIRKTMEIARGQCVPSKTRSPAEQAFPPRNSALLSASP